MARFRAIWLILIILLGACSSTGIPRATPTVAPTVTPRSGTPIAQEPTRTPVIILTHTSTPNNTATAIITADMPTTPTQSAIDGMTETISPTQTATSTATNTPTLSPTLDLARTQQAIDATESAYVLQTSTAQAEATQQTINQQASQTALAESVTATARFYAQQTAVAQERAFEDNQNATATAISNALQATSTAFAQQELERANAQATISQLATNVAFVPTIPPPETLTFATQAPDQIINEPLPELTDAPENIGEGEAQDLGQSGEGIATISFPTLPPFNAPNGGTTVTVPQMNISPVSSSTTNFSIREFTIGAVVPLGQGFVGVTTGHGDTIPRIFARNPANPDQFVQTSHTGALYVNTNGVDVMPNKPFSEYTGLVSTSAENEYFVSAVAWSANGRYVAFVVDGRRGGNTAPTGEDGVHLLDTHTGEVRTLVRDCPYTEHPGCMIGGQREFLGSTSELHWSPDSSRLIVRQQTNEQNGALYIVPLTQSPDVQPSDLRYEFGTWTRDGQRIVVSGRTPTGNTIIGTINPDNSDLQVILDGNARGLSIQHAVQHPNGSFFALARPHNETAVRIIDQNGNFISPPIGNAPPQSVIWSSDRSSVTVIAGGVQYIAYVNGSVQAVTVTGDAPIPENQPPDPQPLVPQEPLVPPPGETSNEGGIYSVGQQLRIQSEILNIRAGASVNEPPVRDPLQQGEYVRVIGGPVENDDFEWWQVVTADGAQGWIVSQIGVGFTFVPAD